MTWIIKKQLQINEIQSEKILRYICIIVADIYNDLRR